MPLLPLFVNRLAKKKNQDMNLCEYFLLSFEIGGIDQEIFVEYFSYGTGEDAENVRHMPLA